MLHIENFAVVDDSLHYIGDSEYIIAPNYPVNSEAPDGYSVFMTSLDDAGEPYDAGTYSVSTLSEAIATIERLETGAPE